VDSLGDLQVDPDRTGDVGDGRNADSERWQGWLQTKRKSAPGRSSSEEDYWARSLGTST
jgi:hypothetical protein